MVRIVEHRSALTNGLVLAVHVCNDPRADIVSDLISDTLAREAIAESSLVPVSGDTGAD